MSNNINGANNVRSISDQPVPDGQSSSPRKELRRPHESTHARISNGPDSRDSSLSPMKKTTTLSATAKEFVPKAYSLSVTAAEFVPRQSPYPAFPQNNLFEDFQRLVSIRPNDVNTSGPSPSLENVAATFRSTLYDMTIQPGSVEDALRPIIAMLNTCSEDTAVNTIVEILFEQSIAEPNFRYTGAKVVQYLSNELKSIPLFANFRNLFLTRCKEEYLKKEELISHPESISRLCGFTMFMGELFLHLEVEKGGKKEKIATIRFVIRDLLLVLLEHPTDETVKCATQLLKMAGAAIEDTAHLNKPDEGNYSGVFSCLERLSSFQHLNKTSQLLISSVLNLKSSNWGRRDSSSSQSNIPSQYSQNFELNEPVFYNSQGQPISREEAGFNDYNSYLMAEEEAAEEFARWEAGELDDGQYYESWSSYPENYDYQQQIENYDDNNYMDDETEAAYEEFLKSQVQGRHHH